MPDAIVEAAGRCLIERGGAALSTRAVASAAGVNQSLIHYYFGTKERLMLAVLERMNRGLVKRQREMYEAPTSFADKWAQASGYFREDLESGFVRLLIALTALGVSNRAIGDEVRKVWADWRGLIEGAARDALAHFRIRSVPAEIVAAYVTAFWKGMELDMMLGAPDDETHYWESLAAFERFLRWLESERSAGRRPLLT
jgi:AcrR family transcriptional regulator